MSENISMTRIVDLPDTSGAFEQNGLGADMYIPINGHPNPYGLPPPPAGGIAPPQQTQSINTQYKNTMYSSNIQQVPNAPQYSQEQFNEMFTQQQQRLPQRDIPMNISEHMQDEQIQANYIPKPKLTSDYIHEYQESTDRKIREHEEKKMREKRAASWFDEVQIPIMIALLYFIFQLPIINTVIFKRFSFLSIYRDDGNFNLLGLTMKSILFASMFYSFHKSIEFISNF
jgi:hypothetical protein